MSLLVLGADGFGGRENEGPTKTLDNIATLEPITPGGLSPSNNVSTLGKMQAGSLVAKLVVLIEGCKYILSDAPSASVLAAYAGHDATEVLGGLFVELQNSQSISPDDPLPQGGRCIIRVLDEDHTDAFGIYVNKRASGDKTTITSTIDRNDTSFPVARGTDFSAGDAYIGTECIGVSSSGASTLTVGTRGKYSALGCDSSGSGGQRFARHHRVSTDPNTTLSNPVISEVPRNWLGKFVTVALHTWDEATQQLNTRAQAQILYAGRIVGISDNANEFTTDIEVEHIAAEFKNAVVGRDLLSAEVAPGIQLVAGRVFTFSDTIGDGTPTWNSATDLAVVASGASGAYQMNEGQYNGDELCAILSRWLAQAKTDAAINGSYTWTYAVTSNDGPRTKCQWTCSAASDYTVLCALGMPAEAAAFLGLKSDVDPGSGQQAGIRFQGPANQSNPYQGECAPYSTLVFKPWGPGSLGYAFGLTTTYELDNERGAFIDQSALFPAVIKASSEDAPTETGLFLFDEKTLVIARYDEAAMTLTNVRIAPFQAASDNAQDAVVFIGRRMDEPQAPITIRQVLLLEGTFASILNQIVYSTGTSGYNHGTYDTLPAGVGIGIPGSLLGPEWERSLANLPGAQSPIAVMIDEPTKFSELFRDDFRLRRAFIRWHNQGFEFATWRTPMVALAEHTLNEGNKAAPVGTQDSHRVASEETDQWHYSVCKIDYARDFGTGRNVQYLKSIQLEDQAGTDGGGNLGRSLTLKMRNTFPMFMNSGAAVEELIKEYLVGLPMFSRPSRTVVRSIDLRYFETIAVGDIVLIEDDPFCRDPLTGQRGINSRAGIVSRKSYNIGGPTPGGSVRSMVGEVELFFLDTHRSGLYSPGAEIDYEKNYSGFSAGYNSTTKQIWLAPSRYSMTLTIQTRNGPVTYSLGRDAEFVGGTGYKLRIVEIDPADTAAPDEWEDTVVSRDGDRVTLTTGLAGWDATKKYRVMFDDYADCTATQQDYAFQADTDEMIVDEEIADQYCSAKPPITFIQTSTSDEAELVADSTWGDGKPLDVGTDAALAKTANAYIDYKSAIQCPMLWSETPMTGSGTGETFDTSTAPGYSGIVCFGSDILSGSITRNVTCSLWLRSSDGTDALARVVLCRVRPLGEPSVEETPYVGLEFFDPRYTGEVSRTNTVTTTSTTWGTTTDLTLSVNVKDLMWGCAWVVVELSGSAECRGFAKFIEGPRTNAA